MEQQPKDDNLAVVDEHVSRWISTFLYDAGVDNERTDYLSYYQNVLRDLPNATAEDWDLAAAVVVQIISSNLYGNTIDVARFKEASMEHVEHLMIETEREQLKVPSEIHSMRKIYEEQPRFGTYVYSRIAMAMLSIEGSPENLIRIYEDVLEKVRPSSRIDVSVWNRSLVREPLEDLYEQVGRFEDALNLSVSSTSRQVWIRSNAENGEYTARRFIGWLRQLLESGAVAETKRFLDLIYVLLKNLEGIDQEEREELRDCAKDTRQHWAWFYGYALGKLLVERPSLRQTLLHELIADEWAEGWHAGSILVDIPRDSWSEYRLWALNLYDHADIEHRVGQYTNDYTSRTNSGGRQPPHLSAQSDLYWAMRVGYADAHMESGEDKPVGLLEIAKTLDQVRDTTSSSALRVLRIESEMDRHWQDITRGLPPTEEQRKEMLQQVLGIVYDVLPERTIQHLAKALDRWHAKDPDGQRVAIGQGVESLFHEIINPEVRKVGEDRISLKVPNRGSVGEYPMGRWDRISIYEWAQVFETIEDTRWNLPFGFALRRAYPALDLQALKHLHAELKQISKLRGNASHNSPDSVEVKVNKASELWNIAVGGEESTGFLEKFCAALGMVERRSD